MRPFFSEMRRIYAFFMHLGFAHLNFGTHPMQNLKNFVACGFIHTQLHYSPHSLRLMYLQKSLCICVFMFCTKIPVDDIKCANTYKNFRTRWESLFRGPQTLKSFSKYIINSYFRTLVDFMQNIYVKLHKTFLNLWRVFPWYLCHFA